MEELNRAKRNSADVIQRYAAQVKTIAESELGLSVTERQTCFACLWFVSVMHAPDQIVHLLRDPAFRASEGFRSISHTDDGPDPDETVEVPVPFLKALTDLINRYSIESKSNTPDFILAQYVTDSLDAFARATTERGQWYGHGEAMPQTGCASKVPGDGV
jgi:hypothetical protein